jgi:2-iminobutanoate/2-iminopropanoate deaminase
MEHIKAAGVQEPGSYAQAIRAGNTLYLAGLAALDERGNVVARGDVEGQADFVWQQIGRLLAAAGAGYANVAKVTTYLVNMADRQTSMRVRAKYLGEHLAASTLVGTTGLAHPDLLIEIEVVAVLD